MRASGMGWDGAGKGGDGVGDGRQGMREMWEGEEGGGEEGRGWKGKERLFTWTPKCACGKFTRRTLWTVSRVWKWDLTSSI